MHKSVINGPLARAAQRVEGVTFNDLYEQYPDYLIDVKREQELLAVHDVIVWQHPFHWYSAPSIVKEWCDVVLEYGYAYGPGGTHLRGKTWVHAITTGGAAEAYHSTGVNRYTVKELMAPFEQTAHLCGMNYIQPRVLHGALSLHRELDLPREAQDYARWLTALRDGSH